MEPSSTFCSTQCSSQPPSPERQRLVHDMPCVMPLPHCTMRMICSSDVACSRHEVPLPASKRRGWRLLCDLPQHLGLNLHQIVQRAACACTPRGALGKRHFNPRHHCRLCCRPVGALSCCGLVARLCSALFWGVTEVCASCSWLSRSHKSHAMLLGDHC